MTPEEFVGYQLYNTTAISAIVSTRVWHGLRPVADTLPSINYYQVGGGLRDWGFERATFSISCRAVTPAGARDLARLVMTSFGDTSGTGTHGVVNDFEVARASMRSDGGLIPEPEGDAYNSPVDIQLVYAILEIT